MYIHFTYTSRQSVRVVRVGSGVAYRDTRAVYLCTLGVATGRFEHRPREIQTASRMYGILQLDCHD